MRQVTETSPVKRSDRGNGDPRVLAGTYRIGRQLGSGTMGRVFEAVHLRLGTRVALKMLRAELVRQGNVAERFQREASLLAGLSVENVVRVFDCGQDEHGDPFFVMERLDGEDLRAAIERDAPLSLQRALHVGLDVCRGLAALHAAGVVHRDIKPANLFLVRDPFGVEICKVLDLGVARIASAEATAQDTPLGTLRYMAPEQLTDCARVGPRADVYATGAVLYECITGSPPHTSQNVEQLMFDILNRDPPPIARPGLPEALNELVMSALSRSPDNRPATIAKMADGLERVLRGSSCLSRLDGQAATQGDGTSELPVRRKFSGQVAGAAGLLAAFATTLGAGIGWQLRAPVPARSVAPPPVVAPFPIQPRVLPAPARVATENPEVSPPTALARAIPRAIDSGQERKGAGATSLPRRTQVGHDARGAKLPLAVDLDDQNPYAE